MRRKGAAAYSGLAARVNGETTGVRAPTASALQEREHGQDAAVVGVRHGEAELAEDRRDVLLDGSVGDDERGCDRRVGATLGHQLQHLALAGCQLVERAVRVA